MTDTAPSTEDVRKQIRAALRAGAMAHVDPRSFALDKAGTPYMAPQVLTNVNHRMSVMMEESFGPVVGIMKVADDAEAIELMNDSPYGLTAAIWTEDAAAAQRIGDEIATGTVFMNRCDYLDPALTWTGVKGGNTSSVIPRVLPSHGKRRATRRNGWPGIVRPSVVSTDVANA